MLALEYDISKYDKVVHRHSLVFATCKCNHDNILRISANHKILDPQRHHDESIILWAGSIYCTGNMLHSIKIVRLSHNISNVSEIYSVDGR